jgi:hypothetical protein
MGLFEVCGGRSHYIQFALAPQIGAMPSMKNSGSFALRSPAGRASGASILGAITLVAYICQSAFFGPIRYFLVSTKLEKLWFVPDLLGLVCVAAVLIESPSRKHRALIFMYVILLYCLEGYLVSGSVASVLSTFKALVPLFCGLLLDRRLLARPFMKALFLALLLLASIGVVFTLTAEMPWADLTFEGVGVEQKYKGLQWIEGSRIRSYGFAGDEHGAASSIVTLFILFSLNARKWMFYLVAVVTFIAVEETTSRTNLLAFIAYVGLYSFTKLNHPAVDQFILKWSLRTSYMAAVLPLIIVGIALSFNQDTVPDQLLSLWIRATYTWFVPFTYMDELAPVAFLHGFGLGGFSFGLLQSDLAALYTPVDNFVLFNFLAFGMPYVFFYFYQCRRLIHEQDPYRVMIFIVTMIDGLALRGWSDSPFMILFGYASYCVFRGSAKRIGTTTASIRYSDAMRHRDALIRK